METVISGLQYVAAVRKMVEQGSGHLGIAEDRGPFAEAEVCGDDHAGSLIEFAQQMEEYRPARRAERQIAELVKDHEIKLSARCPALPFAFSNSSALTSSMVEKKRAFRL